MSALGFPVADWPRLSALLDEALALPPAERSPWLRTLSAADERLRPALAALLSGTTAAEPTLPALGDDDIDDGDTAAPWQNGDVVGPYRLLQRLGSGGMGSVWLARRADGTLQRPVALKLPRGGARPGLAERLARERDVLAALSHPNIAQLYDAGVDARGQPYLALEAVAGTRIDEYCRTRRLGVPERLRLFLQAAQAVAHAHARLVVHRDIKPSNLLVVDEGQGSGSGSGGPERLPSGGPAHLAVEGQVKLLDFGIAKLLDPTGTPEDSTLTRDGVQPLTPDYASPEQLAGAAVDTRSDVYALGVLLYELLTGERPFRRRGAVSLTLETSIKAPRPSDAVADAATRRALRGDLDTIVMKALKADPAERYATVGSFADDVERHLQRRPVLARPDSAAYVLRRLVVRHRLAAAAVALALVAVAGGGVAAAWQAHRAAAERERAEGVKDFLAALLRDASPHQPSLPARTSRMVTRLLGLDAGGGDVVRLSAVELLREAARQLDGASALRDDVRAELVGVVGHGLAGLGDSAGAAALVDRAVARARAELGGGHRETLRLQLVQAHVAQLRGRHAEATALLDALLPALRTSGDAATLARALRESALLALDYGAAGEAAAAAAESVRLADAGPAAERIDGLMLLAQAQLANGRRDAADAAAAQALALAHAAHGGAAHARHIEALVTHGRVRGELGDAAGAARLLGTAVDEARRLYGRDAALVGLLLQQRVGHEIDAGALDAADASSAEALRVLALHLHAQTFPHAAAAVARAAVLVARGDAAGALVLLDSALATLARVAGPWHPQSIGGEALRVLALARLGRRDEAAAAWRTLAPRLAAAARALPLGVQRRAEAARAAVAP